MTNTQKKEIDVTATEASETSEPAGGSGSSHKSLSVTTGNAQTPRKNAPDGDNDTHEEGAQDPKINPPMTSSQDPEENFRKRYVRVQKTISELCIEEYDDFLTAVVSLSLMLIVTVIGTTAMACLALLLCLLFAGIAMTAFVAYIVKSPAVQRALKNRFPGATGETASRRVSVASDHARLATATLAFGIWFVAQSVGTGMFMAVEFLGPSKCPEEQTSSAAGSPMVVHVVDTAVNDPPLPCCSVEEPSAARSDTTPSTFKYWKRRHVLFSKFDEGILMDEESFYSVCPEALSVYIAEKCGRVKVAVDPFCGAGGNIIQLTRLFDKVIAVDIDPDKIIMAKQNAAIYGVLEKIEFVVGDFFKLENQLKGDVIVTSPPWGGPEYSKMDVIGPLDLCMDKILEVGKMIAPKILLHLPKNLDTNECWKMCNGVGAGLRKIENVFMDKYLNSTLLYVRSNNNNAVTDVVPKPVDIHLRNSFRRNERYSLLKTYQNYFLDVDALVSSRRASL